MKWKVFSFEDLTIHELYTILQERNAIFVVEQECAYQEIDGRDQESLHLSAWDGDVLVAYARLMPAGVKYEEPSIGRVIVNSEYRGQGIARELIDRAMKAMREKWDVQSIKLHAQSHLTSFYGSFGFDEISESYLDDGIPHTDMRWTAVSKEVAQ